MLARAGRVPGGVLRKGAVRPSAWSKEKQENRPRCAGSACSHRPQEQGVRGWGAAGGVCWRGVHWSKEGSPGAQDVKELLTRLEDRGRIDWATRDKYRNKKWLLEEVPEGMRNLLISEKIYRSHLARIGDKPKQLCGRCGLQNRYCICTRSRELPQDVVAAFPHRILLYSHVKEIGRSSNTGGLVRISLGTEKTGAFVADIQEQEERLDAELARDPARTVILFPSEDSITVQQYLRNTVGAGEQAGSDGRGLTIVLVDGTWSQARRLVRRFPSHVPRVRLSDETLAAAQEFACNSPMRDQVEPDRVCSLTALVYLLRDLKVSDEVPAHLLLLLRMKSEVVLECSDKEWKPNKLVSTHTPKAHAEEGR